MTDDAKQTAWRQFCEQLEALGVNPHLPDVPEDDPRHEQVQAIVAEYRGIPLPLFPLPESWEGTPPLFTITSLDDVSRWLRDEWNSVTAIRLGSEDGFYQAKYRANQTIRNAHRILDGLGIDDRPERLPPAENLEECEREFRQLEQWFRDKHASDYEPKQAATLAAKPRATAKKRSEIPDDDELNLLIKRHLKQNPRASIRDVSDAIGISIGKVNKLETWRLEMARRKSERTPASREHRQLNDKILASVGKDDDPAKKVLEDEAIWQWLLEQASPKERAELHMKSDAEKVEIIELSRETYKRRRPDADD